MSGPGAVIADRYRLVRQVGSGGMGVVWEGWDERLGRPVAVKQLRAQVGIDEAEAELANNRAMREARITALLHHRYAVPVFDVAEHEGQPCIIMPFLPSMPLSAVLREGGPLTPDEAARVGTQVSSALAAAHQLDIVHRDVKPGNILIGDDGAALISDFGISHALGDATLTSTGLVHGTPAYLAPEVARGEDASFASDVYSLGATLYAALEGSPPFGTDKNSIALLHRVATGEFDPPEHAGPLTPLVTAMLAADPAARPTMQQVAASLAAPRVLTEPAADPAPTTIALVPPETPAAAPAAVAAGPVHEPHEPAEPVPAVPTAVPSTPHRPPPRRPRRAAALVLTLVVLAAGAVVLAALLNGWFGTVTVTGEPSGSAGASESPQRTSSPAPSEPASSAATPAAPASASERPTPTPTPAQTDDEDDDDDDKKQRDEDQQDEERNDEDDGPTRAAQLAQAVTGYYALMPGDTDAAWPRMTAAYQSGHAGGRQAYERFWSEIRAVSVSDVSSTPPDQAQATITYRYRDGRVVQELTAYRLEQDGGRLKIAASEVISSTG